ncbi:MAG: ABC transporter substrate-binding protein [Solirubrobacteraceae bacterium]|nr:ABC transporter substrate-binding protein [Solirubrobacteraceae bacterium]
MASNMTRREALQRFAVGGAGLALGGTLLTACGSSDGSSSGGRGGGSDEPIRVGAITDLTGAYGIVGKANKAIAEFTVDEINANGGVLGRPIELIVVDGASDPATWGKVARQLVTRDKVEMVIGDVSSAEREAVKSIIAGRGRTLYICPASYEGGECYENTWTVGAVPNQQVNPTVDYLLEQGARSFYLCGNDYSYPRNVLKAARARIEEGGGEVVGEDYIPVSATDAPELVRKTISSNADAVFEVIVLPASVPYIKGVVDGGYEGLIAGTLFDETINPLFGRQAQGLIGAQDYFATIDDPFTKQEVAAFRKKYPKAPFGSALNSPAWYRGLYLWKVAVENAGSTDLDAVNEAMNSASYDRLIGGPSRFVPGTKHVELTMYLGEMQADGSVKVLKDLGPQEPEGQCNAS